MRFAFGLVAGVGLALFCTAARGEPPEKPAAKAAKLAIGDSAPALKVTKWLSGPEVKQFEPGKVYVVEFWATWCGPCIGVMPLLSDLQAEYRDKGLIVIGVTVKDERNSARAVEDFVAKRGKRYGYSFAYSDDRTPYDAYMTAAGLEGIPTAFVVGRDGKIAYIGHAMELDLILPKVVAGTWRGQPDIDEKDREYKRFNEIIKNAQTDPATALKAFEAFEADHPKMTAGYYYRIKKLQLLLTDKQFDAARELSESLIRDGARMQNTILLSGVQMMWTFLNPQKKHAELVLKAAEAGLAIEGDRDAAALSNVAEAHAFAGNKTKAEEYARKAVEASEGADRKQIEQRLKKLLGK